jgi:hypothetical protein
LARYVASIADLPLPTKRQKENFADYVSHSHSWYKHLSPYPPGVEFHFFIDEHAGRERKHGMTLVKDRTQSGYHYSQIPTRVYRPAFGYLAYIRASTNKVPLVVPVVGGEGDTPQTDPMARVWGDRALLHGLPEEIWDAGATRLTGAVHTLSAANVWVWEEERLPERVDWPQESGGRVTLQLIFDRCREIREHGFELKHLQPNRWNRKGYPSSDSCLGLTDAVLHELLAPEQRRQRTGVILAIDRMCEVIARQREKSAQVEA